MEKKRKKAVPETAELRIQIIPLRPKPPDDRNRQFYCVFPMQGSPDMQITAKTARQAKELLEDFLFNELSCRDIAPEGGAE